MERILFIVSMVAVTIYLIVAAIEDYKTCEVTRWKHLLGFVPANLTLNLKKTYEGQRRCFYTACSCGI